MITKDRMLMTMESYCKNHNKWKFHSDINTMIICLDDIDAALVGIATDSDFRWYTFYLNLKWYPCSIHYYNDLTEENLDNFSINGQFYEPLTKEELKLIYPLYKKENT